MSTSNAELRSWVEEIAILTQPETIQWCDGSQEEYDRLIDLMTAQGTLMRLNEKTHPRSVLHRSDPSDVARTEHLTFICTKSEKDAGPVNNWMAPSEAHAKVDGLFAGCMRGRTMYVVPYVMGPLASPYASAGVEITDSAYVVASMRIMTRMGQVALDRIEKNGRFVKGLHSTGDLSPDRRYIMHFPEERMIKSIGSGYGGNALLGKKCHSLRIASWDARNEGWLAEHMVIMGIENPQGETYYIVAAFPSACGKTNLAMLQPPASMPGYKIWTVGEDIAWMHLREDGRLWAVNPEAGLFGVAPGTGEDTNANMLKTLGHDAIYTNVALTEKGQPWWEGLTKKVPAKITDWKGQPYTGGNGPAAHPNSRFTVRSKQMPTYSERMEDPEGVPISAILFGGRRAALAPLVFEAVDWEHGVFVGASAASETTAAATGQVGVVRRDPMAMLPFCGYNMADYWNHWLSFGGKSDKLPKIFHVNWFRQDEDNKFIWPGFGENLRVLLWVLDRCKGIGSAVATPIGYLPTADGIDIGGLDLDADTMQQLLVVDPVVWHQEIEAVEAYFEKFGDHTPQALRAQAGRIKRELLEA